MKKQHLDMLKRIHKMDLELRYKKQYKPIRSDVLVLGSEEVIKTKKDYESVLVLKALGFVMLKIFSGNSISDSGREPAYIKLTKEGLTYLELGE